MAYHVTPERAKFAQDLALRLKNSRVKSGLTHVEMAHALGYATSTTVAKWEMGTSLPPHYMLADVADLLGVSLDFLLRGQHSPRPRHSWRSAGVVCYQS